MIEKIKYITNKELLPEIHRSKMTYCYVEKPEYRMFDGFLTSPTSFDAEELISAKKKRAARLSTKEAPVQVADIREEDLVFRVMTGEHIPHDPTRKRRASKPGEEMIAKTNFPPFKHFAFRDGVLVEVARSHWEGDLDSGQFSLERGRITDRLARMFMLLVSKYATSGQYRGYTYNDEMQAQARLHLCQVCLQFDESKGENPFAFYTQIIKHCFHRLLNDEKKNHNMRDELMIMAGAQPSFSRQIDNEIEQRRGDHKVPTGSVPMLVNRRALLRKGKPVKSGAVKDIEQTDEE